MTALRALGCLAVAVGFIALCALQVGWHAPTRAETILGATVRIEVDHGSGSGTVIASRRKGYRFETLILTNFHVIEGEQHIRAVRFAYLDGHKVAEQSDVVEVVRVDKANDLALLRFRRGDRFPAVAELATAEPGLMDSITAIGCPKDDDPLITAGIVTDVDGDYIRNSAPIYPGNSGGGLYDREMRLVGVPSRGGSEDLSAVSPSGKALGSVDVFIPHMAEAISIARVRAFLGPDG